MSALVFGAVVLAVLFALPSTAALALLLAIMAVAGWEWSGLVWGSRRAIRVAYSIAVVALCLGLPLLVPSRIGVDVFLVTALLWWICAFAWVTLRPGWTPVPLAVVAGLLVLVPAWLALRWLLSCEQGAQWILFCLLIMVAADSGAFFAGRHFGRVKLAPLVSPNKTWEGVMGGVLLACMVAIAGAWWFDVATSQLLLVSVAAVCFSIVGDLLESMFKRAAGVKDSGRLLPGHGGILDRIDSLTAGAPALVAGLRLLGVLQP
ncbi:MAG: phosphatidate cytidylyltransferase [Steroidobacteraceae bacterium]